ncbi:MAG: DNA internalization-related competence protein ComEC/Rec2 [Clostridiales bacterium]|nr:DNA internalization-related competence protein ComEC/Rec2 [Clostridiales bacterium]
MVKRPLVWVLGAFIMGTLLAWYKIEIVIVLLLMLAAFSIIYLLFFHLAKEYVNRHDCFLWSLPIILLLGFMAMTEQMKVPALEWVFEEEAECRLSGTITQIVQKSWGLSLYASNITVYLSEEEAYHCENVLIYCSGEQNYRIGNGITVYGQIKKFSQATNPGQFNEKLYYQTQNIDYKVMADEIRITNQEHSPYYDFLSRMKQNLIHVYRNILTEKEAGTIIAMLLGEKYLLDDGINELYQQNGISHILSISGLHVSLLGMAIYKLLKRLKFPFTLSIILAIIFLYSYGALTNFSVSTVRSVIMMVLLLLSAIFGKTYDMLSAISLSAFLILLGNPIQLFNVGFQLSFSAVFGMAVLLPCFQKLFSSKPVLGEIYVSISAQIATMPFVLFYFYQLPIYSVFINLLLLPLSSLLLLTALIAGVAGTIAMPIGVFCIGASSYILRFYEWICGIGASLPKHLVTIGRPDIPRILLYLALLLFFHWSVHRYKKKRLIFLLPIALLILILPDRNVGLEITMLDVGQGEAIFMETERGTTYLIDGGSLDTKSVGKYRIQPFLLSNGVDHIDYVFVSHTDQDHISGLKELMQEGKIKIHNLLLPYLLHSYKEEAYVGLEELAKSSGINVNYFSKGDLLSDGELKITCLHPSMEYVPSSKNSYSMVLSVSFVEFDLLLTGDLEKDGEAILMATYPYDYDILKVAHHGSKYSTSEGFLQIAKPELALISCGKANRYGHPHIELLDRLDEVGSEVVITYESGAITIMTDGKKMVVEEYLE